MILSGIVIIQGPRVFYKGQTVFINARAIARALMKTGGTL